MNSSESKTDFLALDPNSIDALRPELQDEYTQMAYDFISHNIKDWLDTRDRCKLIATAKLVYHWNLRLRPKQKRKL